MCYFCTSGVIVLSDFQCLSFITFAILSHLLKARTNLLYYSLQIKDTINTMPYHLTPNERHPYKVRTSSTHPPQPL